MSKARDVIAREIEPQAWTAHGVPGKDSIAYGNRRKSSERKAYRIINALHAGGYRIAGPEDRVIGKGELDPVTVARITEAGRAALREGGDG